MASSIASLRSKDADGGVALTNVPTTLSGRLLGVALLADSSPPRSHTHRYGKRLVTASLSIHTCPGTVAEGPARGHITRLLGDWPTIVSDARIFAASGDLIALGYATFIGLTPRERTLPLNDDSVTGPRPELDEEGSRLAKSLCESWRWDGPAHGGSRMAITPELRNRFGPMHGAAAHAALSLLALALAQCPDGARMVPAEGADCVLDGRVRFLRPITSDDVEVTASVLRRSRGMVDVDCAIVRGTDDQLATGQFAVRRHR